MKKGRKGWAERIPKSEGEKQKFQEIALCRLGDAQEGGLKALQVSLQGGNDQSNNDGNQEQEQVQDSGRDQEDGDGGGEMQDSYPVERFQFMPE